MHGVSQYLTKLDSQQEVGKFHRFGFSWPLAPGNIQETYRKTSNISRTLVGSKIVDNSNVVGASPVGAAPTTSSFST